MLSKESEQFLNNLRAYLMTSGKKESVVQEIVTELRQHIQEAEADGKSVEDIIGQSPEAYMKSIRKEIPTSRFGIIKMFLLSLTAALAFILLTIYDKQTMSLSYYYLFGIIILFTLTILMITFFGYYASIKNKSKHFMLGIIVAWLFIQIIAIGILVFSESFVNSPRIYLEGISAEVIRFTALAILVTTAIWIKSPIFLLLAFINDGILLPQKIAHQTAIWSDYVLVIILIIAGLYSGTIWYKDLQRKRREEKGY